VTGEFDGQRKADIAQTDDANFQFHLNHSWRG